MFNNIAKSNLFRALTVAILGTASLYVSLTPRGAADERDKKTIVTFNAPVEIPGGKTLPAGTYVFKLLDSTSNRNIVQIFDKDEKQLYATVLAVPNYRLEPSDKPVIQFEERPSGSPEALRAWFYPGDNYGQEFVYPHDRAVELAKRTKQNVLSMRNDMAKNISNPAQSASAASVKEMQNTKVSGVNPSGEDVDLVIVVQTEPADTSRKGADRK